MCNMRVSSYIKWKGNKNKIGSPNTDGPAGWRVLHWDALRVTKISTTSLDRISRDPLYFADIAEIRCSRFIDSQYWQNKRHVINDLLDQIGLGRCSWVWLLLVGRQWLVYCCCSCYFCYCSCSCFYHFLIFFPPILSRRASCWLSCRRQASQRRESSFRVFFEYEQKTKSVSLFPYERTGFYCYRKRTIWTAKSLHPIPVHRD